MTERFKMPRIAISLQPDIPVLHTQDTSSFVAAEPFYPISVL